MSQLPSLLSLDNLSNDTIDQILSVAGLIEQGKIYCSEVMKDAILCPLFFQDSSRTYVNSITSFLKMGGKILPINLSHTRIGGQWEEPVRDFVTLVNACCDYIILRLAKAEALHEFTRWSEIPIINAGNGSGNNSEHPMQALVDLYVIRQNYGKTPINILMVGGKHIRTTRTQVKLFHRMDFNLSVISPDSQEVNDDMDDFYENCKEFDDIREVDLSPYDLIYHNGVDEDPNATSSDKLIITLDLLKKKNFKGKIMHSLPRKNELEPLIDETDYNLYFSQMQKSQFVFQSVFNSLKHENIT